jgi:hypothetical protein
LIFKCADARRVAAWAAARTAPGGSFESVQNWFEPIQRLQVLANDEGNLLPTECHTKQQGPGQEAGHSREGLGEGREEEERRGSGVGKGREGRRPGLDESGARKKAQYSGYA